MYYKNVTKHSLCDLSEPYTHTHLNEKLVSFIMIAFINRFEKIRIKNQETFSKLYMKSFNDLQ